MRLPFATALRAPLVNSSADHARPVKSTSPVSFVPLMSTCAVPRAFSSEPVPVDRSQVWVALGVAASFATARSTRPLPWATASALASGLAVPISSALTWSGVRPGRCCNSSAAAPETTAADCEVPEPRKNSSPVRAPSNWASR